MNATNTITEGTAVRAELTGLTAVGRVLARTARYATVELMPGIVRKVAIHTDEDGREWVSNVRGKDAPRYYPAPDLTVADVYADWATR